MQLRKVLVTFQKKAIALAKKPERTGWREESTSGGSFLRGLEMATGLQTESDDDEEDEEEEGGGAGGAEGAEGEEGDGAKMEDIVTNTLHT